jgi:S1-C subfamily serine protease
MLMVFTERLQKIMQTVEGARAIAVIGRDGIAVERLALSDEPNLDLATALKDAQRSIYGVDNRKDHFDMPKAVKPLAASSVALVKKADLTKTSAGWQLQTVPFQDEYQLCSDETFAVQPLGCFCSGVLVAPDVIATAGHCVERASELAGIRFVFGFRMIDEDQVQTTFDADDVYTGKQVIGRQLTADGTDWALVKLDRPVKGRTPVKLRTSGKIGNRDRVFVIGHPCGLPQKFADGASVQLNARANYFTATLDTYGGNSGSPVFSAKTKALEGLLVRGQTDFVWVGNCRVSQVYPSSGSAGEDVTRTAVWLGKVPNAGGGAKVAAPKRRQKRTSSARKTSTKRPKRSSRR